MKKLLAIFALLFVLLPSSIALVIRTKEFKLYAAPSMTSKVVATICGLAELDVLCQKNSWSQVTGLDPLARARKPLWAVLDGGKRMEGVPLCNGTEPSPLPQNFTQQLKECDYHRSLLAGPPPNPPCNRTSSRNTIAVAARWSTMSGRSITYSRGPNRWLGISQNTCPYSKVPLVAADSSSFVTWLYWSAFGGGHDFLNNQNWKAGSIATMSKNGVAVPLAKAREGDVVFYGRRNAYDHVAVYVGAGKVVSFKETGIPKLLPINHRRDYSIRSYLPEEKRRRI